MTNRWRPLICGALTVTVWASNTCVVNAEFFPSRPVYDYNNATGTDCSDITNPSADHGRCGPVDGPVFNSFINTPSFGDERSFLDARLSMNTAAGAHHDPLDVGDPKTHPRVEIRLYVDNDANEAYGPKTTAHGTKVRLALPTVSGNRLRAVGYVSALNATPEDIEDTLDLVSRSNFRVRYVSGSSVAYSNDGKQAIGDQFVKSGALIGYSSANGELPAGFDKSMIVHATLEILPAGAVVVGGGGGSVPLRLLIGIAVLIASVGLVWRFWDRLASHPVWGQVIAGVILLVIGILVTLLLPGAINR